MRLPRKGAFTLIELLVVVAIIGLLVGMVMPSLSHGREAGRRTKCCSNLHAIGQAVQGYLTENRDRYPAMIGRAYARRYLDPEQADRVRELPSMSRALDRYVGSQADVFECPADRVDPAADPQAAADGFRTYVGMGDYSDPADRTRWGTSYEWWQEFFQTDNPLGSGRNWTGYRVRRDEWTGPDAVPRFAEPDAMMMSDLRPFHGEAEAAASQVYLYADMHVEAGS